MSNDDSQAAILRKLLDVQAALVRYKPLVAELEGHRDRLLLQLADSAGAHDRRPVAVR
ncbi:MAG TPA: hypothetical protein VHZ24_03615 [Pirellulales bacterium]|jgi:hypothetical protein|nr:hypothetical protein [Pirellulales bacterium]